MGETSDPFVVEGFDQNGYNPKGNDVYNQGINARNDKNQVGKQGKPTKQKEIKNKQSPL